MDTRSIVTCLALWGLALGCSYPGIVYAEDTSVADAPTDANEETDGAEAGNPCTSPMDCAPGRYCDTGGTCGAGTCRKRPDKPSMSYAPVCSCDAKVTYWNAEYAAFQGASFRTGECPALECAKCPGGSTCVGVYETAACIEASKMTSCWDKPAGATCEGAVKDDLKQSSCTDMKCISRCQAILTAARVWPNSGCTP